MKKEDRELLLKDLCARLPYKVQINHQGYIQELTVIVLEDIIYSEDEVKPYLRPMSSMTEEEKKELIDLSWFGYCSDDYDNYGHRGIEIRNCYLDDIKKNVWDFEDLEKVIDWLNAHYFDYRGLIEKSLALEAPKDMYVIK